MADPVSRLLATLDLEETGPNRFRGHDPGFGWQRIFGGQVVGQALAAANRTVPDERPCHSLHGYFLLPGDPSVPIDFEVDPIRDGKSFTTRRVVARQGGPAIFSMTASFHRAEAGLDHALPAPPDVPHPDELPGREEFLALVAPRAPERVRRWLVRERPIEFRPTEIRHYVDDAPLPPHQYMWLRTTRPLPDDPAIHRCVLAYLSDMALLDTALFPHGLSVFTRDLQTASLDHAVWFHRPFRADEWLLYACDTPSASGARGFTRGLLYDLEGRLVASTAQEGLLRLRD